MESEPPLSGFFNYVPDIYLMTVNWGLAGSILILILLLVCSAMISGSEVAFFSLSPGDMHNLEQDDRTSSQRILTLRGKPRFLLATILITNNFVNISIVLISDHIVWHLFSDEAFHHWGMALNQWLGPGLLSDLLIARLMSFLITVVAVTFLLVLFGEVAPKIYAKMNNVAFAQTMSTPLHLLTRLLSPLSHTMVSWSKNIENKLVKGGSGGARKEDIGKAIELAVSKDPTSKREADILKSIVKFNEVPVKQIMRSRVDVVAADVKSTYAELLDIIRESGYSRIPVFEEDFDNIQGILYVKDLIGYLDEAPTFNWQSRIRTNVMYIPESKRLNELLKEFQKERLHMAIVVDEYGGSGGIVTLEDVMEEVIGEIKDEFDEEDEMGYKELDSDTFIFEGKTLLNDVCRIIGVDTDTFDDTRGNADSLAGLVLELLGKIPSKGVEITHKNFTFQVMSVSSRRIEKIRLKIDR